MKALLGVIVAVSLISPVSAGPSLAPMARAGSPIIHVAGGCGRDYHRTPRGFCAPNWREWERGWSACPPGWHLGPRGRRCWPN